MKGSLALYRISLHFSAGLLIFIFFDRKHLKGERKTLTCVSRWRMPKRMQIKQSVYNSLNENEND